MAGRTRLILSVVGIPGAGKTTLAGALSARLGLPYCGTGALLRERARYDEQLRRDLDLGRLAPEPIVLQLVDAALSASGRGLVLDGFPRHRDQVGVALSWHGDWRVIYLAIDPEGAMSRIAARDSRPEDEPAIAHRRAKDARAEISDLMATVPPDRLITLDASRTADLVLESAVGELTGWLGRSH